MLSKSLDISKSTKKGELKRKKYEYDRLFKKGCRLSYLIYFLSIIFFLSWLLGNSKEYLLVSEGSFFSRTFFFLNPNLFREVILRGNALSWISGAVSPGSFLFLVCYLFALFSFLFIICSAICLFLISYHTSIKPFHYISCLSVFPIISCFFLTVFIFKLAIYQINHKLGKPSRFDSDFFPEQFDEPEHKLDPIYLASRPVTSNFGYSNYKSCYRAIVRVDSLKDMYMRITDYLK